LIPIDLFVAFLLAPCSKPKEKQLLTRSETSNASTEQQQNQPTTFTIMSSKNPEPSWKNYSHSTSLDQSHPMTDIRLPYGKFKTVHGGIRTVVLLSTFVKGVSVSRYTTQPITVAKGT